MGGLIVIVVAAILGWPWWVFVIGVLLLLIEARRKAELELYAGFIG